MSRCRILVLGLDSVPPDLAFEHLAELMPCLCALRAQGAFGPLRSTDPPITIPAWMSLFTGRDPGELGLYGFRSARPDSYETETVTSYSVRAPRLWDLASQAGLSSVIVGVPPSFPVHAPQGCVVTGCFLTPSKDSAWIDPPDDRQRLESKLGPYLVDVEAHRSDDRAAILTGARALSAQRFGLLRELSASRDPHLAVVVDIGPDRLHHGLLASLHPGHPRRRDNDPLNEPCRQYYASLDHEVAQTIDAVGGDPLILVCSDHGVQPLEGGLCLNDWLIERGDLVLREHPPIPSPLSRLAVDWTRTRAYALGGHYGRIILNLRDRQPQGTVDAREAAAYLDELHTALESMTYPGGQPMANKVLRPQQLYRELRGTPPDLFLYCDELRLRAIGTVGHHQLVIEDNDTGADEANHALYGMFVAKGPGVPWSGLTQGLGIQDLFEVLRQALVT